MVEAGSLRYLPDRQRLARELRKRPSQPIFARRSPLFGRGLRSHDGLGRGRQLAAAVAEDALSYSLVLTATSSLD